MRGGWHGFKVECGRKVACLASLSEERSLDVGDEAS